MFSPQDCVRPTEGPPPLDASGAHSNSKMIYLLPCCRVVDRPWDGWLVNVQVHGMAIEKRYSANGRAAEVTSYRATRRVCRPYKKRGGGAGKGKGWGGALPLNGQDNWATEVGMSGNPTWVDGLALMT